MTFFRKVIKTGNSLCLTLPSKMVKNMNIKEGDIAALKASYSKAKLSCIFSGHPKQLSLLSKSKTS